MQYFQVFFSVAHFKNHFSEFGLIFQSHLLFKHKVQTVLNVITDPVFVSVVLQVHACDDPAVRGCLAVPQRLVKALSLSSLEDFQASRPGDLVDEPQAAPIAVVHRRAQQEPRDIFLRSCNGTSLPILVFIYDSVHSNETAWRGKKYR